MLTPTSDSVTPPFPNIVIAGGRKAMGIARYIRKASMGRTFVCIVQHPHVRFDDFDLVAVPMHDVTNVFVAQAAILRPHEVPACAGTILVTNGAPNRITPGWLDAAREKWCDVIGPLPGPRTAVLIGGNSKHHRMSAATMDRLISHLKEVHASRGGSLMITVSRRTPQDLRKKLEQAFAARIPSPCQGEGQGGGQKNENNSQTVPHPNPPPPDRGRGQTALSSIIIYTGAGDNPYAGFLAYADYIIVTTDSTSMISDAASTGKPIEFFPLPGGSRRNDKFLTHCRDLGVGVPDATYEPWHDSDQVADEIISRMKERLHDYDRVTRQ